MAIFFKPLIPGSLLMILFASVFGETLGRMSHASSKEPQSRRTSSFYRKKMTEGQKKLISPSAEDLEKFSDFLDQDDRGIFRLLPKGKYEFTNTISVNRDPDTILPIRGGGAYYSFTKKNHTFWSWSEIALSEGQLIVGFTSESLAMFTILGDVPLESITTKSPGIEFLAKFKAPKTHKEALAQRKRFLQGIKTGGFPYHSSYPAIPNVTYVLRSIIYKKEGRLIATNGVQGSYYRPHPMEYDGADTLIAFRVIRWDENGSIIILWKRLEKYRSQKLKYDARGFTLEDVEKLVEAEAPTGSNISQVMAFLGFRGISHSHLTESQEITDEDATPVKRKILNAYLWNVRGERGARLSVQIKFYFDDDQVLVGSKIETTRR